MIQISQEVQKALLSDGPVVALESTIITHGLPYPDNLNIATELEQIVRDQGAIPATIAVIDGQVRVGLSAIELQKLAETGMKALKLSVADIPLAIKDNKVGSATVAATSFLASKVGISVFATGGIGGVHRSGGGNFNFDISHDLERMVGTDIVIVTAGAKAILDLPATLEYLETKGVLVLGYKTSQFPAFYSCSSGLSLNHRVESSAEIAILNFIKQEMGINSTLLVANPISPEFEIPRDTIEPVINEAINQAIQEGVFGKRLTPYLLGKIANITGGKSVECNLEIIRSNVRVAVQIARDISSLQKGG